MSLAKDDPLAEAVARGAAAGAIKASRSGTFAALPTGAEVDQLRETGRI